MTQGFDSEAVARLAWRQGSILGPKLAQHAHTYAPKRVAMNDEDRLIVTSHDCDVVSPSLDKEPVVEILRGQIATATKVDTQLSGGRNPRMLHLAFESGATGAVLVCSVHDRWPIPRDLLQREVPQGQLADKERRLVAEWLAKRYIRAAFPTAFDRRWRAKTKTWQRLLRRYSEWLQGVYLRLNTLSELPEGAPYRCHLILAVPLDKRTGAGWPAQRDNLEREVQGFWDQFKPGIECAGVEPLGTDEITLADIVPYQRFDGDWVSFDDDTSTTPMTVDMAS